ncbi:Type III restriction system methylase [Bibersteinia trehalosi USDA-ARS-USMARC-192]|uniref:DNA methyltransferase n=1 Tax=Bibersteinia trehalosi TaxID=47735 RepID=UPI0002C0B81C|nr:DNA methyltransferase [Bibersteinia trehalosi]AGH39354.1 Type III restriction system methylase [Bibersteinia trehalosi USDA-ARS-USMARC-192]
MLDLVKAQTERIDATFLEPACGSGNFLAEILHRKLTIAEKYKKIQLDYERNAVLAVASLYGIELLADNVSECRNHLLTIFSEHYQTLFPNTFQQKGLSAVEHILSKNIVCDDVLSMQTNDGRPLCFTEWKISNGNFIQRHDFIYHDLVHNLSDLPLFSDDGEEAFIPQAHRSYPRIHFLELGND